MSEYREIRATFDRETITVYQAYNESIAFAAIGEQKFVPPFSFNRMTWIKPSFLWMMERSGWGQKSNQEYVLAIKIIRSFWEEALSNAVLTHPENTLYQSDSSWEKLFAEAKIYVQWDPERDLHGKKLPHRSIQVGVSRFWAEKYNEAIVSIEDLTPLVKKIYNLRKEGKTENAKRLLPTEKIYPLPPEIARKIGIVNG